MHLTRRALEVVDLSAGPRCRRDAPFIAAGLRCSRDAPFIAISGAFITVAISTTKYFDSTCKARSQWTDEGASNK